MDHFGDGADADLDQEWFAAMADSDAEGRYRYERYKATKAMTKGTRR